MIEEKQVTVQELRELYLSGEYTIEIDTPDGYQTIGKWFDKGVLSMVRVATATYETVCAFNHMIQLADNTWVQACELDVGVDIQTAAGIQPVMLVEDTSDAECYDFEVMHPNHRYYGDGIVSHNSGKSYICAGNIIKDAQDQGIYVVLVDSENALDEKWLKALDVDTSEDKMLKLSMSMVDDVAKTIFTFMTDYKAMPEEDRPKVLFVIDSLGMLLTPTDVDQFQKGDMKGDMGRKPKALTSLVRNTVNMIGAYNVGLVCTNHTYSSQDIFNPDDKISGGQGFIYASSIVVAMKRLKLKEDTDGNKITDVRGIRAACKVMKTRYAKPFEGVQVKIPYDGGMSLYSGLVDLFEKKGLLEKSGNRLLYIAQDGEEIKKYRKEWQRNEDGCLDRIMIEFHLLPDSQADVLDQVKEETENVDSQSE
jgi:RecA/RadA recombinase